MSDTQGVILQGLERVVVFNRLRAQFGLRRELPRLLQGVSISPGSRCLEIGAGLGWGTLGLVQWQPTVRMIATDYDRAVLPLAQSYIGQHAPTGHVSFCQADAKSLPFPDESFDIVLALYVLHHVLGYSQALGEIGRVTKPDGRFLCIDVLRIPGLPRFKHLVPPEGLISRAELMQLLTAAGFGIERWVRIPGWGLIVACKEHV